MNEKLIFLPLIFRFLILDNLSLIKQKQKKDMTYDDYKLESDLSLSGDTPKYYEVVIIFHNNGSEEVYHKADSFKEACEFCTEVVIECQTEDGLPIKWSESEFGFVHADFPGYSVHVMEF